MFECIRCTKQAAEEEAEEVRQSGTPTRKEAVKSLTAQIKDIVLKFSGAYKQLKPSSCTGTSSYRKGLRSSYADSEANSEGVQYPYMGGVSSGSTPPCDLRENFTGGRTEQRFIGSTSGVQTTTTTVHEPVVPEPEAVVEEEKEETKVWVAQVEPGVDITFVALPNGANDLRRIRFNREMFDKWQAQVWWGENYDRIRELYNVQKFNRTALNTPPASEDEQRDSSHSRQLSGQDSPVAAWLNNDSTQRNQYYNQPSEMTMYQGNNVQNMHAAGSSRTFYKDEFSFSNFSEIESEWIEQDEPGVFVTIRQFHDGSKELRRVKFR